ncbi:MAG: hypothetical protein JOY64_07375 [Alphaproteobacteria bacterium]|nr:hypothetical protein [Alphaproteobacteria bacterium]MBV8407434.1 hypothetical protein [Alphaproteobacteria bacterium]
MLQAALDEERARTTIRANRLVSGLLASGHYELLAAVQPYPNNICRISPSAAAFAELGNGHPNERVEERRSRDVCVTHRKDVETMGCGLRGAEGDPTVGPRVGRQVIDDGRTGAFATSEQAASIAIDRGTPLLVGLPVEGDDAPAAMPGATRPLLCW